MGLKSRSILKSCAAWRKDLKGKGKAKGKSDVGPIHRPLVFNPSSVRVVHASNPEDSAASFQGPSEFSDHRRMQPTRHAKLLRIPIVDSDIKHQFVFPQGSSSSSNNNNSNSDNVSSISPQNDDCDDEDVCMSGGSTVLGHANCPPPWPTFAPFYTQKEQCKKLPFFERVFSRPMKLGVQNTLSTLLLHDD